MKSAQLLILLILCTLFLLDCSPNLSGTIDETQTVISLSGYVYYKENSQPAPNIITKLKHLGFSAVTNNNGYYKIAVTDDTLQNMGINLDTIQDTVEYYNGPTLLSTLNVSDWIDTLPALYIIQRNIYGKFIDGNKNISRIEAVLTKIKNTDTVGVKRVHLWFNTAAMGFSGFVYFQNTVEQYKYMVYIDVYYGIDSIFTGRSQTLEFTDIAGDIEIPTFNPFNARPIIFAGKDTTVSINDTIRLHATAIDSFGGAIIKWEWDFGNIGFFKQTTTSDTIITAPSLEDSNYQCIIRGTDNDGNRSNDTIKIIVLKDTPLVNAGKDSTVRINSPVPLKGTATQQFGTIVMYKWDFDGDGNYDDSSSTNPALNYTYTHETAYNAKFYVRDDDGNEATDVRVVTVQNSAPFIINIRPDTTISIKDSIALQATAVDSDGTIKEYAWDGNGDGVFEYISANDSKSGYRYNTSGNYKAIIRVTDDDNKAKKDTVSVMVLQDIPVPYAGKDTFVIINSRIKLHGHANDSFGVIIKWEWDIGNTGTFTQTSTSDTDITAPSSQFIDYQCVLRITDDDWNNAKDTVIILICSGSVTDIEGNMYHTIKIGNQEWTVENLRTTQFNDGTTIPLVMDNTAWNNLTTPGYCYYRNTTNADSIKKYGALYNWYAVDTKKLVPTGWRVPSNADWDTLQNYLIANGYNWDGTTFDNKIAKSLAKKTEWVPSGNTGAIGNNLTINNRSGFSAFPCGYRYGNGDFNNVGCNAYWWSGTEYSSLNSYNRILGYDNDKIQTDWNHNCFGYSVRCVRE